MGTGLVKQPQTHCLISFSAHTYILSASRASITIARSWFFILLLFFQTSQNCIVGQGNVVRLFFQRRMKIFTWNTYKAQLLLKEIQMLNLYSILYLKPRWEMLHLCYMINKGTIIPSQENDQLKVTYCTEAQGFKMCAVNDPSVTYMYAGICFIFTLLNIYTLNLYYRATSPKICNRNKFDFPNQFSLQISRVNLQRLDLHLLIVQST